MGYSYLSTLIVSARRRAWAKSYAVYILNYISAVLPNAFDNRIAISGDIADRSLMIRDNVGRVLYVSRRFPVSG